LAKKPLSKLQKKYGNRIKKPIKPIPLPVNKSTFIPKKK
jgi:hypothetical protein